MNLYHLIHFCQELFILLIIKINAKNVNKPKIKNLLDEIIYLFFILQEFIVAVEMLVNYYIPVAV